MVELKTSAEIDAMARDGSDRAAAGWTLRTASGARAAHSEHTVAVTADGARILTS